MLRISLLAWRKRLPQRLLLAIGSFAWWLHRSVAGGHACPRHVQLSHNDLAGRGLSSRQLALGLKKLNLIV